MVSRLAPTPSGFLHWGNLFNFALTWASVRKVGGTLWLRIDDVDATRMRPEYVEDVFTSLQWLGLEWDQGPRNTKDFFDSYSQQLRKGEYWDRMQKLETYACDCSRLQIQSRNASQGTSARYDGHCRNRGLEFEPERTVLRLSVRDADDLVVWTKDNRPAYQVVSILDDLRMGMTHLVRGEDLRETSLLQTRLAKVMGEDRYSTLTHGFHRLLLGEDGKKLSKSSDSESLHSLRIAGAEPKDAWLELSQRAGLSRTISHPQELLSLHLPIEWITLST